MKRSFLLLIALFAVTTTFAQKADRYVLFEHFTNTCCGPCATQNPYFQADIIENAAVSDKVHHIAYHPWWPCNWDPMYAHNESENSSRTTFYSVSGVPRIIMQGNQWSGQPTAVTATMVNNAWATGSDIRIEVDLTKDATNGYATIKIHTVGNEPNDINMRMRVAVVETELNYSTAPGTNGEKYFPNVFRKFISDNGSLPDHYGEKYLPASGGDFIEYNYTFALDSEWDADNIYIIAWVQGNSKEVLNSGSSEDHKTTGVVTASTSRPTVFYPNPAGSTTVIRLPQSMEATTVELVNVLGHVVKTIPVQGNRMINLDTSDLAEGMYLGRINSADGTTTSLPLIVAR
jgi:hypothetical protein